MVALKVDPCECEPCKNVNVKNKMEASAEVKQLLSKLIEANRAVGFKALSLNYRYFSKSPKAPQQPPWTRAATSTMKQYSTNWPNSLKAILTWCPQLMGYKQFRMESSKVYLSIRPILMDDIGLEGGFQPIS